MSCGMYHPMSCGENHYLVRGINRCSVRGDAHPEILAMTFLSIDQVGEWLYCFKILGARHCQIDQSKSYFTCSFSSEESVSKRLLARFEAATIAD